MPMMPVLILVIFTAFFPFSAAEELSSLKLIEFGVTSETLAQVSCDWLPGSLLTSDWSAVPADDPGQVPDHLPRDEVHGGAQTPLRLPLGLPLQTGHVPGPNSTGDNTILELSTSRCAPNRVWPPSRGLLQAL